MAQHLFIMQNKNQTQRSNHNNNKLDLTLIGSEFQKYEFTPQLYLLELIGKSHLWQERSKQQIHDFLSNITALYNPVPYHNITHAFDVMIYFDLYLTRYGWQQRLHISQPQRILMLIAAYAHDSGHQGFTNAFYKNSNHPWALDSESPLQNMHASNLRRLLREHSFEVDTRTLQDLTEMILKTDNFYHGWLVKKAQALKGLTDEQLRQPQNTLTMNCLLLHTADLNNTAKETVVSMLWTTRLYEEFQNQNLVEQQQGLQMTCNGYGYLEKRVSSNIIFFEHLVVPLFRTISELEPRFRELMEQIEKNKTYWKELGHKNGS